jgi:hypothetical protein
MTLTERMKLLLGESNTFVESLDAIAGHLEEGGLTLTAESPEAYLAGVQEILETYEVPEATRKDLQELIGTLAALGLAGAAGKWLHGKYKKWSDSREGRKVAKAHAETEKHYNRAKLKARTAQMQKHMQAGNFSEPLISAPHEPESDAEPESHKETQAKAKAKKPQPSQSYLKQAFVHGSRGGHS